MIDKGTDVTHKSVEEIIAEMESKRNPIAKWIDSLFHDEGLLGYRPSYILFRPFKVVEEIGTRIKHAYQRVVRGYDEKAAWSIDYWLSPMMVSVLKELKENKHGTPTCFFEGMELDDEYQVSKEDEEKAQNLWNDEIEKMIVGFESAIKMNDLTFTTREEYDSEYNRLNRLFEIGMASFTKYYFGLWD